MIELVARDGLGRVSSFTWREGRTLRTPALLFVDTARVHPGDRDAYVTDGGMPHGDKFFITDEGSIFSRDRYTPKIVEGAYYIPKDVPIPMSVPSLEVPAGALVEESAERVRAAGGKVVYPVNGVGENAGILAKRGLEKFDPEIFALCNANELRGHGHDFAATLASFRNALPSDRLLYMPGIAAPSNIALFAYCGFDLFDTATLALGARKGVFFTTDGALDSKKLTDIPCSCQACTKAYDDAQYKFSYEHLLNHAYNAAMCEISTVRNAIYNGNLRELVELRIHAEHWMVALLRNLDLRHYKLQEEYFPVSKHAGEQLRASSKESLYRPDIVRFRKRIADRYKKPASPKTLLFLPCSAKKPYSFSRSHRAFREAIDACGNPGAVHEVILTSPLGLVPRELELFYPAQQYDIPVTGDWDEIELATIREMVKWYVSHMDYDEIVIHIPDLTLLIETVVRDVENESGKRIPTYVTAKDHATSDESLDNLRATLEKLVAGRAKVSRRARAIEDMHSFARFQFGDEAADRLFDGAVEVRGRYPDLKMFKGGVQLGMLTGERGMISLTLDGGKAIAPAMRYWVEIDDFQVRGNVFAVGVKSADPEIRLGDEVVVGHAGDVRAVGVAYMNARDMKELKRGEAVRVRHKV